MYYLHQPHIDTVMAIETLPAHLVDLVGKRWQTIESHNNKAAPYNYLAASVEDLHANVRGSQKRFPADALSELGDGESLDGILSTL